MLKKEVKEVSRQTAYFIASILVGTFLVLVGFALTRSFPAYTELFLPVFQLGLLAFSLFLGISLFAADMRGGGMEYLLTLPYSRHRLLTYKVIPRAAALLLCVLVYFLLTAVLTSGQDMQLFSAPVLLYLGVSLFIIGVSFSVFRGSFIISGLSTLFIFLVYLAIVRIMYPLAEMMKMDPYVNFQDILNAGSWWKIPGSVYFAGFILLAAFAAAFVHAFKRFDLGSPRNFTRRYLKLFIPIVVFGLAVSWIWTYQQATGGYKYYTLTPENWLVQYNHRTSSIYTGEKVNKLEKGTFYPRTFIEKNGYFYTYEFTRFYSEILQVDPEKKTYDTIYRPKGKDRLSYLICGFKNTIAAIERGIEDGTRCLVLLDIDTKSVKRIKVAENVKRWDTYFPRLFGAGETGGQRFWLLYAAAYGGWNVLAAREDGRLEPLGVSQAIPAYVNGMLLTIKDNQLVFEKITQSGAELIGKKTIAAEGTFHLKQALSNDLERVPTRELYVPVTRSRADIYPGNFTKVFRVDLQTLEVTEVKELETQQGRIIYSHPDAWYVIKVDKNPGSEELMLKALYRLNQGRLEMVREFEPINISYKQRRNYFWVYDTGCVLMKNGKASVYRLPDLEPVHFEGL